MRWVPCVERSWSVRGELSVTVGHPLVDEYLEFCRVSLPAEHGPGDRVDLKTFFATVAKAPTRVTSSDVCWRSSGRRARPAGRWCGWTGRAGCRRGRSGGECRRCRGSTPIWWRGDTSVTRNPVPWGLMTRRERSPPRQGVPLVRNVKTLPRCSPRSRWTRCWRCCARSGTGRWSRRWCSAGCAAARCSGCA